MFWQVTVANFNPLSDAQIYLQVLCKYVHVHQKQPYNVKQTVSHKVCTYSHWNNIIAVVHYLSKNYHCTDVAVVYAPSCHCKCSRTLYVSSDRSYSNRDVITWLLKEIVPGYQSHQFNTFHQYFISWNCNVGLQWWSWITSRYQSSSIVIEMHHTIILAIKQSIAVLSQTNLCVLPIALLNMNVRCYCEHLSSQVHQFHLQNLQSTLLSIQLMQIT